MSFTAKLSDDMHDFLTNNFNMELVNDKIDEANIIKCFNFTS